LKFWNVVYPPTTHPNVGDFGCVPVRTSLPSELPGTIPQRRTLNVGSSLLGRSTEWPEPESATEWVPNAPRVASTGSGWETPSAFATAWQFEIVC
jgi:hypothetical protein